MTLGFLKGVRGWFLPPRVGFLEATSIVHGRSVIRLGLQTDPAAVRRRTHTDRESFRVAGSNA